MRLAPLLALSCLFSASLFAATPKPSIISQYGGSYSGTAFLTVPGTSVSGTATASFKANKKKELGTLIIAASYNVSGISAPVTHTFTISKHAYSQTINLNGTPASSSGSAKITKRVISLSGTGSAGGTPYTESGTIRLTKNGILVTDTLLVMGQAETFTYTLKSNHKKK